MESSDLLRHFRLEGDEVIRLSTGKAVRTRGGKYPAVGYTDDNGSYCRVYLHRLKVFLRDGYMPPEVDHRNRDPSDASGGNLVPSNRHHNLGNRTTVRKSGLPRNIHPIKRRVGPPRFAVEATCHRKKIYLGSFSSLEEAVRIETEWHRKEYGI